MSWAMDPMDVVVPKDLPGAGDRLRELSREELVELASALIDRTLTQAEDVGELENQVTDLGDQIEHLHSRKVMDPAEMLPARVVSASWHGPYTYLSVELYGTTNDARVGHEILVSLTGEVTVSELAEL